MTTGLQGYVTRTYLMSGLFEHEFGTKEEKLIRLIAGLRFSLIFNEPSHCGVVLKAIPFWWQKAKEYNDDDVSIAI